jgi:predicted choloylglycine hydrolase
MELYFEALREHEPGPKWQGLFARLWPAYSHWYASQGLEERPTYLKCSQAVRKHMPELVPMYEELCELAGGGDVASRFLSLYGPPPYLSGCSQAIWNGDDPILVRNYDYNPSTFDAVVLESKWLGRTVLGMTDCLVGLTDGINSSGLVLSLTFGGRRVVGKGFGVPIIIRYVLETCDTVEEATEKITRIPSHMAYNVTMLDAKGHWSTVYLSPDRKAVVTRASVATNHQEKVEWASHAHATASVERERLLLQKLTLHRPEKQEFISSFLRPPLYSLAFERGFGTLFTAAYSPSAMKLALYWPGAAWGLPMGQFEEAVRLVRYPDPGTSATASFA